MKLYFLTKQFYQIYSTKIVEMEQKYNRPYAMICIKIKNHIFAVPLRSNINHPHCYKTEIIDNLVKGIDYSKAVIITTNDLDKKNIPKINQQEFNLLKGKDIIVANQFKKYIEEYISIVQKQNNNIPLQNHESILVKYSTLQNYHTELLS